MRYSNKAGKSHPNHLLLPESWDAIQAALEAKATQQVVSTFGWWFSGGAVAAAFLYFSRCKFSTSRLSSKALQNVIIIYRTIILQTKQLLAERWMRAQTLKIEKTKVSGSRSEYIIQLRGYSRKHSIGNKWNHSASQNKTE